MSNMTKHTVNLPLTSQLSAEVAFQNVVKAARSVQGTAELHELLAQSIGVIREQLIEFASLVAAYNSVEDVAPSEMASDPTETPQ